MHFDRIVRTDIVADEGGVLATMRFDEEAIRDGIQRLGEVIAAAL